MSTTVGTLFSIRKLINTSEKPLTTDTISKELGISIRTVQRHAMSLANERLVGIKFINKKRVYDYNKTSTGEVFKVSRNSSGYEYFKLDKKYE